MTVPGCSAFSAGVRALARYLRVNFKSYTFMEIANILKEQSNPLQFVWNDESQRSIASHQPMK